MKWLQHILCVCLRISRNLLYSDPVTQRIIDTFNDVPVLHNLPHESHLVTPVGLRACTQVLIPQRRVPNYAESADPALDGQQATVGELDALGCGGRRGEGSVGGGQ